MDMGGKLKIAGLVVALIPIGFFLLFAVGEGAAGWSHYLQLALPLVALVLAWLFPRVGGGILLVLGLMFGAWYPFAASSMPLVTILLVELVVAVPAVVSGYLFYRAAKQV